MYSYHAASFIVKHFLFWTFNGKFVYWWKIYIISFGSMNSRYSLYSRIIFAFGMQLREWLHSLWYVSCLRTLTSNNGTLWIQRRESHYSLNFLESFRVMSNGTLQGASDWAKSSLTKCRYSLHALAQERKENREERPLQTEMQKS